MATNVGDTQEGVKYGYASDEVKSSPFTYGLNAGVCFLHKFEWIPNGGKDGKEQEALDIIFLINGVEKTYRMFPVVKAFDKNNNEITDQNSPEFKDAMIQFNAVVTHILHAYRDTDQIKAAFSRPINNFKDFCKIAEGGLPKNFRDIPLDIFLQYQWNISEGQARTFLDIPKKMKYGRWLCPAVAGKWKEVRLQNPEDTNRKALYYVDEADNTKEHPFVRTGWFVNSNFSKQQRVEGDAISQAQSNGAGADAAKAAEQNEGGSAAAW